MPLNNKIYSDRISLLQKTFSTCKIDSLIFFNMNNIRYLCGFTGSEGVLIVGPGQTSLWVDGRYTSQAGLETKKIRIKECTDKIAGIVQEIKDSKTKRVGFEADSITLNMYHQMTHHIQKENLVALDKELRMLRACKDDTEISLMKKAAQISSSAMRSVIKHVKPGWTEKELALQLEIKARHNGADGISFETIVAAGEHSALPHAKPTDRKIRKGDFVVIDFGIRYQGYCSDETCTIAFGKLTDRQKNAYQTVKDAHDRALEAIQADIPAADIDQCARDAFGKKSGRYFTHGTGHGVGLDVHEAPRLSSRSDDILKPGMVFTIEPGIYLPGRGGVRIEDDVVITESGVRSLTDLPRAVVPYDNPLD
jgi:Xaa-Pro aminopeptidase/Xaa-Pro dipeptidase